MNSDDVNSGLDRHADTTRKLHELAVEASNDIFCELCPASGQLTWLLDGNQNLLELPPHELPPTLDALKGRVFVEDVPDNEVHWQAITSKHPANFFLRLLNANHEPVWHQLLVIPNKEQPTTSLLLVRNIQQARDVADRVAEERRVTSIETMAAGIAHEFNNNLTPIRGFIELALDHLGEDHPVAKGLQTALSRVEYSAELVEQIQLYGRKTLLNPRPVDLSRVLHSMVRVAVSLEGEKARNIRLDSEIDPYLPPVWVDHARMRQAFIQLVKNAVSAMLEGGTLTLRARAILVDNQIEQRSGDFVRIQLIDDGCGIPKEDLARIFDPFFTTRGRANAKGMGLSMVQGMVAQHGGWIEIRSDEGKGTDVRIFLPIKEEDQQGVTLDGDDDDETMHVIDAATVGRLLVADDEDYIRHLISKVFSTEGWLIDEAHDNNEVLSLIEEHPNYYDLIIVDVTMPGPTIEETLPVLAAHSPKTQILIVSGHARDDRVEQLFRLGASGYMSKPFSPKCMLTKVDEMLQT